MTARVLISENDMTIRHSLAKRFAVEGWQVRFAGEAETLLRWTSEDVADAVVVVDLASPTDPGHEVAQTLRRRHPRLPIVTTIREANLRASAQAILSGSFETLPKPYQAEDLVAAIRRAITLPRGRHLSAAVAQAAKDNRLPLIGRSAAMQALYRTAARLVQSTLPVLITGETGVGKALIARCLHDLGPRRGRAFAALNLVSLSGPDIADRLLGWQQVEGLIELARGGTLYLHAVGDLSAEAQARLMRVLNETGLDREPASVGAAADVRLVASGPDDLCARVDRGEFREDLYYRLGVATLAVPSLRSRPEDVPDLANAFLHRGTVPGVAAQHLDPLALQRLRAHDWPGNVRELENLIRRIQALYPHANICADIVEEQLAARGRSARSPAGESGADHPDRLALAVEQAVSTYFAEAAADGRPGLHDHITRAVEAPLLKATLLATRGNKSRAAALLGISRASLSKKIEHHALEEIQS
ncbi:sigma-54 dependent transcriptional regulator [Phenylobacterium sp.]|uniref:sigma-54-dependent transcriptional regulator n=1 Tax=Phenylobacterium sp. TaxID=1871053 RepID=UPI0012200450|nr:sigma-54 dependent transcriptional regulator [Phenylobacterium sp.]THD61583.1 MAG: response regulator [Phenylobacterium sp.]